MNKHSIERKRPLNNLKHIQRIMRVTLFLMLFSILIVEAETSYSQEAITIHMKSATIKEVCKEIEKNSDYIFVFADNSENEIDKKVDIEIQSQSISNALANILKDTPLKYDIYNKQIVIYKREKEEILNTKIVQQVPIAKEIKGKVIDTQGNPLVGATVLIKNTIKGTTTDTDGNFSIFYETDDKQIPLVISYIGFKTKEQIITPGQFVTFTLEEDIAEIGEVVVTGIVTRKSESYTGSVSTFSGDNLKEISNQNIFKSLKTLDPSINIFTDFTMGSDPNMLPDMTLRGRSTLPTDDQGVSLKSNVLGTPHAPLFILDGFETTLEKIYNMDMNRIQSVTILKDATAKSMYGSKAANGVIVVETKRMRDDKPRVTYNGNLSFQMPDLTSYNLTNALEKLQVEKIEGYYERSWAPEDMIPDHSLYNERLRLARSGESTYWLSKPLRVGTGTQHYVGIEIGEKELRTLTDFSFRQINGVMQGSSNTTLSGSSDVSYRYNKLLFRNLMSVDNNKQYDSKYGVFSTYVRMNPYWNPYDRNTGELVKLFELTKTKEPIGNPLYDASLNTMLMRSFLNFTNNFYIEASLLPGLRAIASLNVSSRRLDDHEFYPAEHSRFTTTEFHGEEGKLKRGSYNYTSGKSSSIGGKLNIQYNKSFKDKHNLYTNTVFDIDEIKAQEVGVMTTGFPSGKVSNIAFAKQYAEETVPQSVDVLRRNLGFLEVLSYDYDNRYLTDLTFRISGASVFGSNNPWSTFWGGGIGWNIHNEDFMKSRLENLTRLKLRASYGSSGNQNFAQNVTFATYNYMNSSFYQGFTGAWLNNMKNPFLRWEESKDFNVGIDLVYKGISATFDYYNTQRVNMVTNLSIAPSIGFKTVPENLGKALNKGFEANVRYIVWQNPNGFLSVYGNFATNNNKIIEISDVMRSFNESQKKRAADLGRSEPVLMYFDGMPINAIWAVPSLGIDPMSGAEIFVKKNGKITYTWNPEDMVFSGSADPKYRGNIGLSGEYKGFGFTINANFLGGGKMYNYTLINRVENIDVAYNVDKRVLTGRWQHPGQNAQFTTLEKAFNPETGKLLSGVTRATTRFVQKRDEFSITSISAYYLFNEALLKRLKMNQLKLTFYLEDLATFSSIKIERGTNYPFARTMTFSITGTF